MDHRPGIEPAGQRGAAGAGGDTVQGPDPPAERRGVRIDEDVVHEDREVHGLRPGAGCSPATQREALHRLLHADEPLDGDAVRALYAISQRDNLLHRVTHHLGPDAVVRLQ